MSEVIPSDQQLRIKAIELCISLFKTLSHTDIEDFESIANDIYQFIKGETK